MALIGRPQAITESLRLGWLFTKSRLDRCLLLCEMRILAVCGSLKAGSANLALLRRAAAAMPANVEVLFFEGLGDLPHFNPDLEMAGELESVARWRLALSESDAVLIASPEYGFSLPGALKNAIDWVIGSGELERKVVAITAATTSPDRGRRGLQALRETLSAVRATIVDRAVLFLIEYIGRLTPRLTVPLVACVANNLEKPRPAVAARERSEISQRSQAGLLNDVLGIMLGRDEPSGQSVRGIELNGATAECTNIYDPAN